MSEVNASGLDMLSLLARCVPLQADQDPAVTLARYGQGQQEHATAVGCHFHRSGYGSNVHSERTSGQTRLYRLPIGMRARCAAQMGKGLCSSTLRPDG